MKAMKAGGMKIQIWSFRLINAEIKRKSGKFEATVFHLGHPLLDRSKQKNNFDKLMQTLESKRTEPVIGIK